MKTSILRIEQLVEAAKDPEYRFLLLEPILSYGIAFGLIVFAAGFFVKHWKLQVFGLIFLGATALVFVPYMSARNEALPRIEQVFRYTSANRAKLFHDNTVQWISSHWLYTAVVVLAAATLVVGARRNQLGYGLSIATVLAGLFAVQNSLWLHYQDAAAVHPNLNTHHAPIEELANRSSPSGQLKRSPQTARTDESNFSGRFDSSDYPKERRITPMTR